MDDGAVEAADRNPVDAGNLVLAIQVEGKEMFFALLAEVAERFENLLGSSEPLDGVEVFGDRFLDSDGVEHSPDHFEFEVLVSGRDILWAEQGLNDHDGSSFGGVMTWLPGGVNCGAPGSQT